MKVCLVICTVYMVIGIAQSFSLNHYLQSVSYNPSTVKKKCPVFGCAYTHIGSTASEASRKKTRNRIFAACLNDPSCFSIGKRSDPMSHDNSEPSGLIHDLWSSLDHKFGDAPLREDLVDLVRNSDGDFTEAERLLRPAVMAWLIERLH